MRKLFTVLFVVTAALAACSVIAANPVGKWKGRFHGDLAKLPAGTTPESRKAMAEYAETMKAMRISLLIRADHTFVRDISGTAKGKKQKIRTEGRWTLLGSTVTTTNLKRNGVPLSVQAQVVNKLTLDKSCKTLTQIYNQGPLIGKIVLKRT